LDHKRYITMTMITQIKTRKEQRKESRKKRRRHDKRRVEEPPSDVAPSKNNSLDKPSKSKFEKLIEPSKPEKARKRKKVKVQDASSTMYEPHPDLAEAIQRDEAEIAELEKRLGLTGGKKGKDKLHKEYSKLEGFGDDFGDFLDDLDGLVDRVSKPGNYDDDDDNIELGDDYEDVPLKPKKKAKKVQDESEDGLAYDNMDPNVAEALRRDDEEIAALEKKLGLSKRKEKDKLYKEYSKLEGYGDDFGDFLDGLDGMMTRLKQPGNDDQYVGNASDGSNFNSDSEDEELVPMKGSSDELDEDDSVLEELERMQQEEKEFERMQQEENVNGEQGSEQSGSDEESEDDASASGSNNSYDSDDTDDDEDKIEPDHDVKDTYRPSQGEDIYGNKIDSESSEDKKPSKYVPPHLRAKQKASGDDDEEEKERMRIISRSLNNFLNRLSEDTLISVAGQVAKLYSSNPTQMVHKLIWKNAKDVCITTPMLMTGLIPVYTACITGVHIQTGDTVQLGEYILENVIVELLDRLKESREASQSTDDDQKEMENKHICNLMLVLCYLYNYGVVHCSFIYDIIRQLIENFSEADVECLLILLSHCGRSLRSDDPTALKEIVLLVQKKKSEDSERASSSRTEFMVSAIMDLKNNKRKREDTVFTEKTSKFRKILGRVKSSAAKMGISKSTSEASLRITLDDILQAETKGRWWKVGASWVGNQHRFSEDSKPENEESGKDAPASSAANPEEDEALLKLASKFRMNTDRKRAVFCIIMGGTDIEDTFEKLCRSSMLQNRSERDTIRVLMECCGNEKSYNKFYGHLAARICEFQPQSRFTLQLAYWDIFKQFDSVGARKAANLAKLLFHLVVTHRVLKLLPVIKTIDLSDDDMEESTLIFLTILLSSILDHFPDPVQAKAIFARSTSAAKNEEGEDADEGIRAGLLVFFMETLKSSPKNKKGSRFRKNFKTVVKELDTDGFEDMF